MFSSMHLCLMDLWTFGISSAFLITQYYGISLDLCTFSYFLTILNTLKSSSWFAAASFSLHWITCQSGEGYRTSRMESYLFSVMQMTICSPVNHAEMLLDSKGLKDVCESRSLLFKKRISLCFVLFCLLILLNFRRSNKWDHYKPVIPRINLLEGDIWLTFDAV